MYLLKCLKAFIDIFNHSKHYEWWEVLIGLILVLAIIGTFAVSYIFLNWYFAFILTLGGVAVLFLISLVIEFFIKKLKKDNDKTQP